MGGERPVLVKYRNILGRRTLGTSNLRETWGVGHSKVKESIGIRGGNMGKGDKNCMGEGKLEARAGYFGVVWGGM